MSEVELYAGIDVCRKACAKLLALFRIIVQQQQQQ
jgi:hypothetical protein